MMEDGDPAPTGDPVEAVPPRRAKRVAPPDPLKKLKEVASIVVAVVVGCVSVVLWFTGQLAEIKTAVARIETKQDSLEKRLARLEGRWDTKFGADTDPTDAGALDAPANTIAAADGGARGPAYVRQRMNFCDQRCAGIRISPCYGNCERWYDKCFADCGALGECFWACTNTDFGSIDNPSRPSGAASTGAKGSPVRGGGTLTGPLVVPGDGG